MSEQDSLFSPDAASDPSPPADPAGDDTLVLRRLVHRGRLHPSPDGSGRERRGLVIDVETTGRSADGDRIIEIAAVPFRYGDDGITSVDPVVVEREDPTVPLPDLGLAAASIPEVVTRLTGIAQSDVAGRSLDADRFADLAAEADLVIAHNASFDVGFLGRRIPALRACRWACSLNDVDWHDAFLVSSLSLEFMVMKLCRRFYGAHAADEDCLAVIELLDVAMPDGRRAMAHLDESAGREQVRLATLDTRYGSNVRLKERGWRWYPGAGSQGDGKCWWVDVDAGDLQAELEALRDPAEPILKGGATVLQTPIDAVNRYWPVGAALAAAEPVATPSA